MHHQDDDRGRLLLHSCCAPCGSHCLEQLTGEYEVTAFYYNPNIAPYSEYVKRRDELARLVGLLAVESPVAFLEGRYDPERFDAFAKDLAECDEGGERCTRCFELRLAETARVAKEKGFAYFTTTLTVSPHKDAERINEIGERLSDEYGSSFITSNFKKKNGYLRSIELSRQYGLYRQDYCGCTYSHRSEDVV